MISRSIFPNLFVADPFDSFTGDKNAPWVDGLDTKSNAINSKSGCTSNVSSPYVFYTMVSTTSSSSSITSGSSGTTDLGLGSSNLGVMMGVVRFLCDQSS